MHIVFCAWLAPIVLDLMQDCSAWLRQIPREAGIFLPMGCSQGTLKPRIKRFTHSTRIRIVTRVIYYEEGPGFHEQAVQSLGINEDIPIVKPRGRSLFAASFASPERGDKVRFCITMPRVLGQGLHHEWRSVCSVRWVLAFVTPVQAMASPEKVWCCRRKP